MRSEDQPVRRTYRFRLTGLVYLSVTGFLAVAAISSQNNLLFWCLGLALAGIAVSGLASGAGLMGVRAVRDFVPDSTAGGELVVRYRISNHNRFTPAFALVISEREPGRRRHSLSPWQRYSTRPVAYVACVGPGQTVLAEARARALRRGRPEFTDFSIASTFPFGLANKTLRFTQRRTTLVYPKPLALRPAVLEAARTAGEHRGSGAARSGGVGDLYGVREYVAGDPLKSISWRASARAGALLVRQHARPSPQRLWVRVVLDGEQDETLIEKTLSLAAGVLQLGADAALAVGVQCPDGGLSSPPAEGRQGLRNGLARLAVLGAPNAEPLLRGEPAAPRARDWVITVRPRAAAGGPSPGVVLAADTPDRWQPEASGGAGGEGRAA